MDDDDNEGFVMPNPLKAICDEHNAKYASYLFNLPIEVMQLKMRQQNPALPESAKNLIEAKIEEKVHEFYGFVMKSLEKS